MHRFSDIQLRICRDLENWVRGSVKVIENVTIRKSA